MENIVSSQAIPAPPGTSIGLFDPQIFLEVIERLGIQPAALVTPWATRTSDVTWEPIRQPPSTNVILYGITDSVLSTIHQATFGHLMPFIAIHSKTPGNVTAVAAAFSGTRYQFYETQAVYAQAQGAPSVPDPTYVHWAKVRDPSDREIGNGSLDQVAAKLSGTLCLGFQTDYRSTAVRSPPGLTFEEASRPPVPGPTAPDLPPDVPPPQNVATKSTLSSWLAPVAVGLLVAGGTFYLVTRKDRS